MWQKTIKSSLLVDHHWLDWALGCWAAAAAEGNWMRIKRWEREVAKTETEWENRIIEQLLNQNRESISPGEKLLRCSLHFETCCAADALLWQFKRAVSLPLNLNSNQRHVSTCKSIMYVFWWLYKCAHAPARNSPPPTSSIIIFREREWNTIWNLKEFIVIHPSIHHSTCFSFSISSFFFCAFELQFHHFDHDAKYWWIHGSSDGRNFHFIFPFQCVPPADTSVSFTSSMRLLQIRSCGSCGW